MRPRGTKYINTAGKYKFRVSAVRTYFSLSIMSAEISR